MVNRAEQDILEIRNLLRTPSPENVELANQKLELVASFLTSVKKDLTDGQSCNLSSQKFLAGLPSELSALRVLMQGPVDFFLGLGAMRAAKFGSYERTGTLHSFELEFPSKTRIHL